MLRGVAIPQRIGRRDRALLGPPQALQALGHVPRLALPHLLAMQARLGAERRVFQPRLETVGLVLLAPGGDVRLILLPAVQLDQTRRRAGGVETDRPAATHLFLARHGGPPRPR